MDKKKEQILVVDDDESLIDLLSVMLERSGYNYVTAKSGEQVNAILTQRPLNQPIDLILLDLLLPGISGIDVYHLLRQHPLTADSSIIVLSAIDNIGIRVELLKMGVDDYVVKPFSISDLQARVTVQIKLRQLQKAKQQAEAVARTQKRYLKAINAVTQQAAHNLDIDSMLHEVVKTILEQFACAAVAVYLYGMDGRTLKLAAAKGDPLWPEPIAPIAQRALEKRETVWQEPEMATILTFGDILLGVLVLRQGIPRLNIQAIRALEILVSQLAPPIANSYLFYNIQRRNRQLTKIANENARLLAIEQQQRQQDNWLQEVGLAISASLEPDEILSLSLNYIQQTIKAKQTAIFLLDESGDYLTLVGSTNHLADEVLARRPIPIDRGFVGRVMFTGASFVTNKAQAHPCYTPEVEGLTAAPIRSLLCAPLVTANRVSGVIQLINKKEGLFSKVEASLLASVASVIAIALDNAQLYRQQVDLLRELNLSQEQLIQSEKLVMAGRLAASLAHEINNPLQAIHSCLQLTLNFNLTPEQQGEYIKMANEETERLMDTVARTLEFAHPSPGKYEVAEVNDIVGQVMTLAGKYIDHANFSVKQQLGDNLPQVRVVQNQVAQVFLNIMLNAFDAIADSGQLLIETKTAAEGVAVVFTDNGTGMSDTVRTQIFDPFFTMKESATGMGLTISYTIIEKHGGNIEVKSKEGEGTVVTVYLPPLPI